MRGQVRGPFRGHGHDADLSVICSVSGRHRGHGFIHIRDARQGLPPGHVGHFRLRGVPLPSVLVS